MDLKINDKRNSKDFTSITFSGFKKSQVIQEILKSLLNNNVETACYWSAELICSGHLIELWELIILYIGKYINIGNPKLFLFVESCIDHFKRISSQSYLLDELELRNDASIRNLFAEIMCVYCHSKRKHPLSECKISYLEFNVRNLGDKLKAPNVEFIKDIFKEGDPKEIYFALNELYYSISVLKDNVTACYWIDWIIEFDIEVRKQKTKKLACKRDYIPVNEKEQCSLIWTIWDIFIDISNKQPSSKRIVDSILKIFCLRYGKSIPKKRKFLLYNCVLLLTEKIDYSIPIIHDKALLTKIQENIFKIYKQIKENEITILPPIMVKSSKDKSINKMEIIKTMDKYS
jgi:hypothetical protein